MNFGLDLIYFKSNVKQNNETKKFIVREIMNYSFGCILAVSFVISLLVTTEDFVKCTTISDQPIYYGPYSSCHLIKGSTQREWSKNEENQLKWVRGSGQPIHSWISSVLPVFFDSPAKLKWDHPKGLYATFTSSSSREEKVYEIGHRELGVLWRRSGTNECDGWLYGRWKITNHTNSNSLSDEWDFSGGSTLEESNEDKKYQLAYVYQDMRTAIVGKFSRGKLLEGEARRVIGYRCEEGILTLKFSKPKNNRKRLEYEESTATFITSNPKLMDPYERSNIYIKDTTISGMRYADGLFAKRVLPHFTLVAVYAGTRLNKIEHDKIFAPKNITEEMSEDMQKNLITLDDDITIDVPPKYSNIVDYRSSLGHKVNHNFVDKMVNAEFGLMNHPRFGLVRCIRSTRAIGVGEEIFVNYGYGTDIEDEGHPTWYKHGLKMMKQRKKQANDKTSV